MNVLRTSLVGLALTTAQCRDHVSAICEGDSCDANFAVEDEMHKVSLLQHARQKGTIAQRSSDDCEQGGWSHCWDDQCANSIFERRRRGGNMGQCRRRTGVDSPTRKCCGDLMYHKSTTPTPAPSPPPENCEQGGWLHCWDDQCANSMFERRRRGGNMGQCRRRTGVDSPTRKCCGDLMYHKSTTPTPSPTPSPVSPQDAVRIKHIVSSRCMSVKDGTNKLQLLDCDGSKGQVWKHKNNKIKTKNGKKCVAVKGTVEDGGKVRLEECNNSDKQKWDLSPKGWFKSKADSSMCLDVEGIMNTANGALLQLGKCATFTLMSDQRWEVVDV